MLQGFSQKEYPLSSQNLLCAIENIADAFILLEYSYDKSGSLSDFIFRYLNNSAYNFLSKTPEILDRKVFSIFPSLKDRKLHSLLLSAAQTKIQQQIHPFVAEEISSVILCKGATDITLYPQPDNMIITWKIRSAQEMPPESGLTEIQRADIIAEMAKEVSRFDPDFEAMLDNIAGYISNVTGDLCIIRTLSESKNVMPAAGFSYSDKEFVRKVKAAYLSARRLLNDRITEDIIENGSGLFLPSVSREELLRILDPVYTNLITELVPTSIIMVPLKVQDTVIGTLSMSKINSKEQYTSGDMLFLQSLADTFSIAILNSKLYTEKLKEVREKEIFRESLRKQKHLLENVLETLPLGVWITDETGKITHGNPAGQKIWGGAKYIAPDEFHEYVGWYYNSGRLIAPEEWAVSRAIARGETTINEILKIQCFDGVTQKIIFNSAIPIREKDGTIIGAVSVNQDITELKNSEELLKNTMQELERSNKELEQFAYTVSHDLQEPIRLIRNYSQLIMRRYEQTFDENERIFFDFIDKNALRMQGFVTELLAYSRLNKTLPEFSTIDCNYLITNVLSMLELLIEENHAIVKYDSLPVIKGNETLLQQLFQNLISNAIKFRNEQRHPEVYISCKKNEENWVFSVKDNGIGIPQEFFGKIFIIFQQVHEKGRYAGSGIGLSTCKKIVEKHNGRIWVESDPGHGSTFYFSIPS